MKSQVFTRAIAAATVVVFGGIAQLGSIAHGTTREAGATQSELDITYGEGAYGQPLHADIRRPDTGGPFPAVVLVHGGGFVTGDEDFFAGVGQDLVPHGYLTMAITYSLASEELPKGSPEYFAAVLRDIDQALDYLETRSDVDASRLGMFGASSGAVLAILSGLFDPRLDAVISYSGTAGDPIPQAQVVPPPPLYAAHSRVDTKAPYERQVAVQQYWESLGGIHALYSTNRRCHALCFWTFRDPETRRYEARIQTIAWLATYVKNC